ncbi:bifunctional nuclease family protein [Candidatus Poribacteria bacterium]
MKILGLSVLIMLTAIGCAHRTAVEGSASAPMSSAPSADGKLYEVAVTQVIMDHSSQGGVAPVIILTNKENDEQLLPIWVGISEGMSIDRVLNSQTLERPGTHDLFADVLGQFQMKLVKVVIIDLRENTYFADMTVELNGETKQIDARPSDAIALALRHVSPIFVSEEVISKGGWVKPVKQHVEQQRKRRRKQNKVEKDDNLL